MRALTFLMHSLLFAAQFVYQSVNVDGQHSVVEVAKPVTDSTASQDFTLIRCVLSDKLCERDRAGFEAIAQLHSQIDDDQDGSLNRAESAEFFRDDLKHEGGSEKFHGADDLITVYDLWHIWSTSEVYNWTVDNVVHWLDNNVELSQYSQAFRSNFVDGRALPRLATNYQSIISVLGIKNAVHKQKLSLKATDVVLFGPPKIVHSYVKDFILGILLAAATGVCYFAFVQQRRAQSHVQKLMKDLSSLQNAEDALSQLQSELEQAQTAQRRVAGDKENLEKKLEEISHAKTKAERLRHQRETKQEEEFSQLKLAEEELVQVRRALCEAEQQLEERQHITFGDLQQWLQMTYEVETRYFEEKRAATEQQLFAAKDMCEKIRRQKGKFLGAFRVAHTASLDETDSKIMSVRSALEDIQHELKERTHRWKQIEKICGFNILTNPGIPFLDSLLRGSSTLSAMTDGSMQRGRSQSNFLTMNADDNENEIPSIMMSHSSQLHSSTRVGSRSSIPHVKSVPALYSGPVAHSTELRDWRTNANTTGLLQPAALLPQQVRRFSPQMPSKFSRPQLAEGNSEESLMSSDRGSVVSSEKESVVFDLGDGDLRLEGRSPTGMMSKIHSEPVHMAPSQAVGAKIERDGAQQAPCPPHVDGSAGSGGNDSDSGSIRSDDRKIKKSPFSKLLHSTKQKP